ncbi:MAG: hypothetical protein AAF551_10045 [Bacteroidota bacterium]
MRVSLDKFAGVADASSVITNMPETCKVLTDYERSFFLGKSKRPITSSRSIFKLNIVLIRELLQHVGDHEGKAVTLTLLDPNAQAITFKLWQSEKLTTIRSSRFIGYGMEKPQLKISLDLTVVGIFAQVTSMHTCWCLKPFDAGFHLYEVG